MATTIGNSGPLEPAQGPDREPVDMEPRRGLSEKIIREASATKGEPAWMIERRLAGYRHFSQTPLPPWIGEMPGVDFADILYFKNPAAGHGAPSPHIADPMEATDARGQAGWERLKTQGVLFCRMETALKDHPELFERHFASVVPADDSKFAALNTAVWDGGTFIYVPPGVEVGFPLQASYRLNSEKIGRFERTLIVADEGSQVQYFEGCSTSMYTSDVLRCSVAEAVVMPGAQVTFTTVQNWTTNVYNLVTMRSHVHTGGRMRWVEGDIGSRSTMCRPELWLIGPEASGEVLSVAYAGASQRHHVGARIVHAAPDTTSSIVSKSVCRDAGRTTDRSVVEIRKGARRSTSSLCCDALLLDGLSRSDAYPSVESEADDAQVSRSETVATISSKQLFYLMSRGLSEEQAMGLFVAGFVEPVIRALPVEYAVEWSRLLELG